MIQSWKDSGTEDIFHGRDTKQARKQCQREVWKVARRKLDQLNGVKHYSELKFPPNNNLHPLNDDWWAIHVNDRYRLVFRWKDGHPHEVSVTDYH